MMHSSILPVFSRSQGKCDDEEPRLALDQRNPCEAFRAMLRHLLRHLPAYRSGRKTVPPTSGDWRNFSCRRQSAHVRTENGVICTFCTPTQQRPNALCALYQVYLLLHTLTGRAIYTLFTHFFRTFYALFTVFLHSLRTLPSVSGVRTLRTLRTFAALFTFFLVYLLYALSLGAQFTRLLRTLRTLPILLYTL